MRHLPFAPLDDIAPGSSLILAPHPDDESLGCGGLIAALCAAGRPPEVVCVTDGAASHPGSALYPPARLTSLREIEMRAACQLLGLQDDNIHFLRRPDAQLASSGPEFDQACAAIANLARERGITTIFATWRHDPHCDHEAVAAMAAHISHSARIQIKYYPVWGWLLPDDTALTTGAPDGARLDITAHMNAKRQAIAAHASQYTDLIKDSPDGFRLPPALLAVFDNPYEVFITP
jgi:LmbE family N-acetylglucosaminyl deacetylase